MHKGFSVLIAQSENDFALSREIVQRVIACYVEKSQLCENILPFAITSERMDFSENRWSDA